MISGDDLLCPEIHLWSAQNHHTLLPILPVWNEKPTPFYLQYPETKWVSWNTLHSAISLFTPGCTPWLCPHLIFFLYAETHLCFRTQDAHPVVSLVNPSLENHSFLTYFIPRFSSGYRINTPHVQAWAPNTWKTLPSASPELSCWPLLLMLECNPLCNKLTAKAISSLIVLATH